MKKLVGLIILLCCGFLVQAQMDEKREEGANEAEFNSNAQERDNAAEIDSREDELEEDEGNTQDVGQQSNAVSVTPSNTGGVQTATTSSAGSPALLAEDNGRSADGTNTVQRASPNIAGSPVPGTGIQPKAAANDNKGKKSGEGDKEKPKAKGKK